MQRVAGCQLEIYISSNCRLDHSSNPLILNDLTNTWSFFRKNINHGNKQTFKLLRAHQAQLDSLNTVLTPKLTIFLLHQKPIKPVLTISFFKRQLFEYQRKQDDSHSKDICLFAIVIKRFIVSSCKNLGRHKALASSLEFIEPYLLFTHSAKRSIAEIA